MADYNKDIGNEELLKQTKAMIRFLESVNTARARQDLGKYKTALWKLEKKMEKQSNTRRLILDLSTKS